MKKGWKTFWIICLIIFCLGMGFCVAGLALGATWNMLDEHTPDWISFGNGTDYEVSIGGTQATKVPVDAIEQHFTGINNIEVEASIIELQILTAEDNDGIMLDLEDEALFGKMNCYKEGDTLVIETNDKFKIDGIPGTVWIHIPEKRFGEVDIDVEVGTVYIEDIRANHLFVNVDAGEAVIDRFKADDVDFECGAGRIEAYGNADRELDTSCGAGEIELSINGKKEDYNYEIECGVGEVIIGNEAHSGIGSTDRYSYGASKEMNIECGIGSITVEFEEF